MKYYQIKATIEGMELQSSCHSATYACRRELALLIAARFDCHIHEALSLCDSLEIIEI